MATNDSSSCLVTFKVKVSEVVACVEDGRKEKEEVVVCVTGSVPVLGNWDIRSCIPLQRQSSCSDVWSKGILLPSDATIEYRYATLQKSSHQEEDPSICLRQWESSLKPRKVEVRGPGISMELDDKLDEKDLEEGWLVEESELQLRLTLSPNEEEASLNLHDSWQRYSILITASNSTIELPRWAIKTKLLDRETGNCNCVEQGTYGLPLDGDCSQLMVCSIRSPSFSHIGFTISLYAPQMDSSCKPLLIGTASLHPEDFLSCDFTHGTSCLSVLSPEHHPMGTIQVAHLLINPVRGQGNIHSAQWSIATNWKRHERTLDVGHRGLGDSHSNKKLKPSVLENTIESLSQAANHGADFVEFDIQFTSDLFPVVYHNFRVVTRLVEEEEEDNDGPRKKLYSTVLVKDLSLSELRNERRELVHTSMLRDGLIPGLGVEGGQDTSPGGEGSEKSVVLERDGDREVGNQKKVCLDKKMMPFPLLKEVFELVPQHVGFKIEVKHPVPEQGNDKYNFSFFDKNVLCDHVIETVYRHANDRKVIFSCFDADVCTMLRLKQPKVPVLFLTVNGTTEYPTPVDIRSRTFFDAIAHAKAQRLLGICIDSYQLLEDHDSSLVMKTVKEKDLVLFTWGTKNESEHVQRQKELRVDAVIYDGIKELIPQRNNIFLEEKDIM